jgi:hypothetical protein
MRYSFLTLFFFYFLVMSLSQGETLRLAKIFTDHSRTTKGYARAHLGMDRS